MSFSADTAVVRLGPGCFTAELSDRWSSLVGIHGGYSAAIVVNAMTAAVDDSTRALRSFAAQFAAAPRPGPVDIEVTVERAGRSTTTTSARLLQEGRVLQVAHAVSSTPWPGLSYDEYVRPKDADPSDTPRFAPPGGPGHFQNADVRLDPDIIPFGGGDEALVAAWLRPHDGEPIDAAWLVAMCDMLPPAVFSRTNRPVKAATLKYVVHLNESLDQPTVRCGRRVRQRAEQVRPTRLFTASRRGRARRARAGRQYAESPACGSCRAAPRAGHREKGRASARRAPGARSPGHRR